MKLSAEHTEAAFFLPMPGKLTEQMTPMKPATSPAALSHHFYLPCSSIHQRWPTAVYCIFINKFYWLMRGGNPVLDYTRRRLLTRWPATTQDQQASAFQLCMPLYPYKDHKTIVGELTRERGPIKQCRRVSREKR